MSTKKTTPRTSRSGKSSKSAAPKPRRSLAKKGKPATSAASRTPKPTDRDPRLPAIGSVMKRQFKGKEISVKVTAEGFEYEGEKFTSISACARHITGYMISGPVFFKLVEPKRPEAK